MEIIEILHNIGYTNLRDFGQSYRTTPLYRASDNPMSLSIKKTTGDWYDFGGRIGGNIYQLVQLTLQLSSLEEARKYLGNEIEIPVEKAKASLVEPQKFNKNVLLQLMPKHDYWLNRGISSETLNLFQGGLFYKGGMAYRYVFPIFNQKDELIGFAGRSLNDNPDYPKWKLRGKKADWLYPVKYNQSFLMNKKHIILVESIGDMLALWDAGIKNTLVTFGVEISTKIIEFLLKIDVEKIIVALNNDTDNNFIGNHAAVDAQKQLCGFFDESQITIALPDKNDFGEMSRDEILLWKQKNLKN